VYRLLFFPALPGCYFVAPRKLKNQYTIALIRTLSESNSSAFRRFLHFNCFNKMKKPLILAVMALFAACDGTAPASTTDSTRTKTDTIAMMRPIQSPFPVMYSSSFAIDDLKNAETVLAFWKAFDDGNIAASKDAFADTFEVHLAEGMTMRAGHDSTIAAIQSFRNSMSSVVNAVNAVMAVKSTDKNEHWVLIWGMEKETPKKGKVDSVFLQETWRFNAAGKADLMYQFVQQPAKK
jgi:hypothetical protein